MIFNVFCVLVIDEKRYIKKLTQCMIVILGTVLCCIIVCLLVALLLNQLGRTMSWYARPIWILFLYVIPTVVTSMSIILFHSKKYHKVRQN